MITPKEYQRDAIESALDLLRYGEKCYKIDSSREAYHAIRANQSGILIEAPTGAGKTLIAGMIAENFSMTGKYEHNAKIIWFWIAPFKGLIEQTKNTIRKNFHRLHQAAYKLLLLPVDS